MVVMDLAFALRKNQRKQEPSKLTKLNTSKLRLAKEKYRVKEELDRAIIDLDNESWETL